METQLRVVNPDIGLDGRWGGQDNLIINELFKGQLKRSHHRTHDAIDNDGILYEIKKQQGLQWFDPRKYAAMGKSTRMTKIIFVIWEKKVGVVIVAICPTDSFIQEIFPNDLFDLALQISKISPRTQLKHPVNIKRMIAEKPELFNVIYRR